jgi:hypothetical protein
VLLLDLEPQRYILRTAIKRVTGVLPLCLQKGARFDAKMVNRDVDFPQQKPRRV